MSDLRLITYFLGMEIIQYSYGIFVFQRKYVKELLKKFKIENSKLVTTPLVLNQKLSKEDKSKSADSKFGGKSTFSHNYMI